MGLKPLQDWAVVRRLDAVEVTPGGILIPDAAKERPAEGIVVSIGPGRYKVEKGKEKKFIPTCLKPGQRIIYGKYSATEIKLDGEELTLVREEDILGTVEGAEELPVKQRPKEVMIPPAPRTVTPEKKVAPKAAKVAKKAAKKTAAKAKPAAGKKTVKKTSPAKSVKETAAKNKTVKKDSKKASKKTTKKTVKKVAKKKTKKK